MNCESFMNVEVKTSEDFDLLLNSLGFSRQDVESIGSGYRCFGASYVKGNFSLSVDITLDKEMDVKFKNNNLTIMKKYLLESDQQVEFLADRFGVDIVNI